MLKPVCRVASFTDAWIETRNVRHFLRSTRVASFTDAWIETDNDFVLDAAKESHLLQMRGLKPISNQVTLIPTIVASFTDAWIETLPLQQNDHKKMSHLLQMRGLKLIMTLCWMLQRVASFTDAWIETIANLSSWCMVVRRIFYRCVD